jgi:Tfp pilus assembly protein PilF
LYSQAIADFDKALTMDSKSTYAYNNRALSNWELGNKSKACADWKIGASLGSTTSKNNLADFCK